MSVWRIGSRWSDKGTPETEILDVFLKMGLVFLGQEKYRDGLLNYVKKGDYFVVTSGQAVKAIAFVTSKPFYLCENVDFENLGDECISETYEDFDFSEAASYAVGCWVEIFSLKEKDVFPVNRGLSFSRFNEKTEREIINMFNQYKNFKGEDQMSKAKELAKLLEHTHNLILHGAPGTGKTHLAREIAEEMGAEVGFVQFHPSYDYTDFVEGLRPVNDAGGGQIGFDRKDGVFKEFCKKAIFQDLRKSLPVTKVKDSSFDIVYKSLLDDVKSGKITSYKTARGSYPLRLKEDGRLLYKENSPRTESEENMKLMYDYFLNKRIYDLSNYDRDKYWRLISELTNGRTKTIDYPEYGWTLQVLLDRAKKFESEKQNDCEVAEVQVLADNNTSFVFIIDEINRGEMSKIFGELFFAIDPGYRGKNGLIKTQYQNLVNESNVFYDGFFVPENVYIIGTMNDIDRNVESMDFAFRRRFTFKEIKAKDTQEQILSELDDSIRDEAIRRMDSLNKAISNIEGLSSAYHIGGAYFLKLKELGNDFGLLWEYHLEGLLREYLRGMEDADSKLSELRKAYENKTVANQDESSNGQEQ